MRNVVLDSTERTLLLLRRSEGAYQTVLAKGLLSSSDESVVISGAFTTLVSYAEFYVDKVVGDLLKVAETDAHGLTLTTLREFGSHKAFNGWEGRKRVINEVLVTKVSTWREWERFDGAIWVRNSIAHGGGGLSRKQKRGDAAKANLVAVSLVDDRLQVDSESLRECRVACVGFVTRLDAELRSFIGSSGLQAEFPDLWTNPFSAIR